VRKRRGKRREKAAGRGRRGAEPIRSGDLLVAHPLPGFFFADFASAAFAMPLTRQKAVMSVTIMIDETMMKITPNAV